jgi:hypothetical protein
MQSNDLQTITKAQNKKTTIDNFGRNILRIFALTCCGSQSAITTSFKENQEILLKRK